MTDNHPITPPPELVDEWRRAPEYADGLKKLTMVTITVDRLQYIATKAARWGADKQLAICLKWLQDHGYLHAASELKEHCRPKPPSLKEQALAELEVLSDYAHGLNCSESAIRHALEQLSD